jgi:hypothetical protein
MEMARKALVAAICILALLFMLTPSVAISDTPTGNNQTSNPSENQYQSISGQEITGAESSVPLNYTGRYVTNQNLSYPYFNFKAKAGKISNMSLLDRMWRNSHLGTMGRAYEGDTSSPDWILPTEYTESSISMKDWTDINNIALNQTLPGTHLTPRFWDLGITSLTGMPRNANIGPEKQSKANTSKNASRSGNQTKSSRSGNNSSAKGNNALASSNVLNFPGIGNVTASLPQQINLGDGTSFVENKLAAAMDHLNNSNIGDLAGANLASASWPVNERNRG